MLCPKCGSWELEECSPGGKGLQYRCGKCGYTGPGISEVLWRR